MAFISYTTQSLILLLAAASLLAVSEAKTIVVGGSEGWRSGFNYTEWVLQNSPFYINDELGKFHLKAHYMRHLHACHLVYIAQPLFVKCCSVQVWSSK